MTKRRGWIITCDSSISDWECVLFHSLKAADAAIDSANAYCDGVHQLVSVYDWEDDED